jgi:enolase
MYKYLKIVDVRAREVIDSRANPTVEAEVTVKADGKAGELFTGKAIVPSGASTGAFEAVELRDKADRYMGKGVKNAVKNVEEIIYPALEGMNGLNQKKIDQIMLNLDKTDNKGKLGANGILAVSMANMKACANALKVPLYKYIGGICATKMPIPMMNVINGGAHASNNIDVQEFMILPVGACCFAEGLRWCVEVYDSLKEILKKNGLSIAVGDEGGFAPDINSEEEALDILVQAVENAGYKMKEEFMISLDVAASEWKTDDKGVYLMPKKNKKLSTDELISMWENIVNKYAIFSIEDPLDEEDWEGWRKITEKLGNKIKLVGDDLFVTNVERLNKGLKENSANAILIKPNQIGTISETISAVQMAQYNGYVAIMSHRSGESEDTTIADLAVALNTGYIKTGAPCRGERTAKYNRLLRIEEML